MTLAVAVLALLVGLVAAVQSWRAADQAGRALDRLDGLAVVPATTGPALPPVTPPTDQATGNPPTGDPAPTGDPTGDPTSTGDAAGDPTAADDSNTTAAVPTLDAQTQYKQRYADETLKVPAGCNHTVNIDLDEPRVQVVSSIAEVAYDLPCGATSPHIALGDDVEGSMVSSSVVTPIECAERIRTSPLSPGDQPVRRGQVYCIKTSSVAARNSAGTWKMVVLEVTATAQDGTITFKASAWDIPLS